MKASRQFWLVGPARKRVVVVEGSRRGGEVSFGVIVWTWDAISLGFSFFCGFGL